MNVLANPIYVWASWIFKLAMLHVEQYGGARADILSTDVTGQAFLTEGIRSRAEQKVRRCSSLTGKAQREGPSINPGVLGPEHCGGTMVFRSTDDLYLRHRQMMLCLISHSSCVSVSFSLCFTQFLLFIKYLIRYTMLVSSLYMLTIQNGFIYLMQYFSSNSIFCNINNIHFSFFSFAFTWWIFAYTF